MSIINKIYGVDNMRQLEYRWTDGKNEDFQRFYLITEEYYSELVGGNEE